MEALGTLLGPWGGLGEVLEGSENEVEKRDPPKSCKCYTKGGPYKEPCPRKIKIKMGIKMEDQDQDGGWRMDQRPGHANVPKGTVADI